MPDFAGALTRGIHAGLEVGRTMQELEERRATVVRDRNYRRSAQEKAARMQAGIEQALAPLSAVQKEMPDPADFLDESGELTEAGQGRYRAEMARFSRKRTGALYAALPQAMHVVAAITATEPDNPYLVQYGKRNAQRITGFMGRMLDNAAAMNRAQLQAATQRETTEQRIESSEEMAAADRAVRMRGQDIGMLQHAQRLESEERRHEETVKLRERQANAQILQTLSDIEGASTERGMKAYLGHVDAGVPYNEALALAIDAEKILAGQKPPPPLPGVEREEGAGAPSAENLQKDVERSRKAIGSLLGESAEEEFAELHEERSRLESEIGKLKELVPPYDPDAYGANRGTVHRKALEKIRQRIERLREIDERLSSMDEDYKEEFVEQF